MTNILPTSNDVIAIVEAFDRHPLGAAILCLLVLVIVLGIWAYRFGPLRGSKPPAASRGRTDRSLIGVSQRQAPIDGASQSNQLWDRGASEALAAGHGLRGANVRAQALVTAADRRQSAAAKG